ncbi:MAG TPA: thermopsin family protease [Thermoplasmata archaeon]|nr:thermopsin family protease [Thermoplasmata archaeon]
MVRRTPKLDGRAERPNGSRTPAWTLLVAAVLLASVGPTVLTFASSPAGTPHTASGLLLPALHPSALLRAPLALPKLVRGAVNPYQFVQNEPAPMGVGDFGVDASLAPYTYSTPEFVGNVTIRSMSTYTAIGGAGASWMTFQLNVVTHYTSGGAERDYWIQNVVDVNSSSNQVGFLNNIWNLSSPSAAIHTNDLSGNGTVNTVSSTFAWYAATAGYGLPGNGAFLVYPGYIAVRVLSSTIAGVPHVAFSFNDGQGWQTYDNVSIPTAKGWANPGFYVTGSSFTPLGVFFDAEFDFTGPPTGGGGPAARDVKSNLSMTLDRWNGHDLSAVPNAFNFGSDTGELISNVVSSQTVDPTTGTIYALERNGSGKLGLLYDHANDSVLNVTIPTVAAGTLAVGAASHAYVGGDVNLTLAPGTYPLRLLRYGMVVAATNVTLRAGEYLPLTLAAFRYPVEFTARGLPANTPWSVNLSGTWNRSSGPTISFTAPNGTYAFQVGAVPGFVPDAWYGTVTVAGGGGTATVTFTAFDLPVTFAATNRPSGVPWGVTIGVQTVQGTGPNLVFELPNGSYGFNVTTPQRFAADPVQGGVNVTGSPTTVAIAFSIQSGYLAGSLQPADAVLFVDGVQVSAPGGTFNLTLPPGTHSIEATASGYAPYFANESVNSSETTFLPIQLSSASSSGPVPGGSSPAVPIWFLVALPLAVVAAVGLLVASMLLGRRPKRPR